MTVNAFLAVRQDLVHTESAIRVWADLEYYVAQDYIGSCFSYLEGASCLSVIWLPLCFVRHPKTLPISFDKVLQTFV